MPSRTDSAKDEISFTGHAVSDSDLAILQSHPGVHVNCDAISTIRRLGRRCPGRAIGIRLNPGLGAGYNERLRYAGEKPTKFGVYPDRFEEAIAAAQIGRLARSTRCIFMSAAATRAMRSTCSTRCWREPCRFSTRIRTFRRLNVGGGLGVRMAESDTGVDIGRWAGSSRGTPRRAACGWRSSRATTCVKDAGLLLVQVNTVEDKAGTRFVGVNAGLGILNLSAYYRIPYVVAPVACGTARRANE